MVVLSNPGTCGTRKCSSWCADIHKDPEYRHPEIQKSNNPYIYGILLFVAGFLDFGILRFLDFWISCVLHLCFQSVDTAPKLDSEKAAFVSVFTVFLRGLRVVGGVTIYIYIYVCTVLSC